ncbi:MAG: hypothetical protein SPLUMA2_SPLUMAMAG2_01564 [uncultured Sulfurimonas sp.]|nr:MAG: hypothetical protein SPLUMA1_SPLUMAMAG1_00715 [uncultured Sulfurimonas sp.]CAI6149467.1 MAG: hypothetical protein SPLUMA2_SPLUMAMAG2_01564 [uncultured Sulfurimonas sp.]
MNINFKVTPSQKETIDSRVQENGFDDITNYIKVVALKMQKFTIRTPEESSEEASVKLGFTLSEEQKITLDTNMKESNCDDISIYLTHVALYGVISAVIEIRSSGKLNAMLERIAKARGLKLDLD